MMSSSSNKRRQVWLSITGFVFFCFMAIFVMNEPVYAATEPANGTQVVNGDYRYTYSTSLKGWSVKVIDQMLVRYGDILAELNGFPIKDLSWCFKSCRRMVQSPSIPQTVSNIDYAYDFCSSLQVPPELPNGLISAVSAFKDCTTLDYAPELPGSLVSAGYMFSGCDTMSDGPSRLPNKISKAEGMFQGCSRLNGIMEIEYVPPDNRYFFDNCSIAVNSPLWIKFNPEEELLINSLLGTRSSKSIIRKWGEPKKGDYVYIDDYKYGFEEVAPASESVNAFWGDSQLKGVWGFMPMDKARQSYQPPETDVMGFPVSIGTNSFFKCVNMETAPKLPEKLIEADSIFFGCINLIEVGDLPSSITTVRSGFKDCESLETVGRLPSKITELEYTFDNCVSLSSVSIPSKIKKLYYTFRNCTSIDNISVPNGVTNLTGTFSGCTALTNVYLPISVTEMPAAFNGCISLVIPPTLPQNLVNMFGTFKDCTGLTKMPEIPDTVESMQNSFWGCTRLVSPSTIPESVKDIGYVFKGCSKLSGNLEILSKTLQSYQSAFSDATTASGAKLIVKMPNLTTPTPMSVINTKSSNSDISLYSSQAPDFEVDGIPSSWTSGSVKLHIIATPGDAGLDSNPYSWDGGKTWTNDPWKTFNAGEAPEIDIVVKGADGKLSAHQKFNLKIDKTAPTFTVNKSTSSWTTGDVTLSIDATDGGAGLHDQAYSFDNGSTWQASNTKSYTKNTRDIYVKVRDKMGNVSDASIISIENIDKTAPYISSVSDAGSGWTNGSVTIEVIATDTGSRLHSTSAYSFDNGSTWQSSGSKSFSSNQTVIVKVRDNAGNISDAKSITIDRIDKTAPTATVAGNASEWTNQDVVLSVTASDGGSGLHSQAYSFDNGSTWQTTNSKSFSSNQTVSIKVRDSAGNVSSVISIYITKIDKAAPTISSVNVPSTSSNGKKVVTVTASDALSGLASSAYSLDQTTWQTGNTFTLGNGNFTVYVRDTVGNIASKAFTVTGADDIPPTFTVSGNPTTWTNSDVTLNVSATDVGSGLHATAYSFDNGSTWQAGNTKSFSSNQTVNIKVRDAVGNISPASSIVINKIDKTAPTLDVSGNATSWTNSDVTLTVTASDAGAGLHATAYSFDNGSTWQASSTKSFSTNQIVQIKVKDQLGNTSNAKSVTINKIDKTAPTVSVSGNATAWTKDDVTLTVTASDSDSGIHAQAYSFDNGSTWQSGNSKSFGSNQTVQIKVKDKLGNVSSAKSVTINKIDKTAPTASVSGNPAAWTKADVTLSITASDGDSGLHAQAYSFDNGSTWQAGKSKSFSANQTVKIKVRDALGNTTTLSDVVISKIDKAVPSVTVNGNPSAWTSGDVTLSVMATDSGSGLHSTPYSFDNGATWSATSTKVFNSNQSVNIRVKDAAGNISAVETVVINKIDKTNPTVQVTGNPTDWTSGDATLTIIATDTESGLHSSPYSFDDGSTWQTAVSKVFNKNGTVKIKVRDMLGNTFSTSVIISKIDKSAPTFSVSGNATNWTGGNVTLNVTASDSDSGLNTTAYSFDDGKTWQAGSSKAFSNNQTATIKVRDAVGNVSAAKTIEINKIDKTAPEMSVSGNPSDWTANDVTLNVTARDVQSGLHNEAYSFDNGSTWQTSKAKIFTGNQTVKVKARDAVGNISAAESIVISKIDKSAPTFIVSGNPLNWTKDDVTLTITAEDDGGGLHSTPYSFDGGKTWVSSNTKVYTSNQTVEVTVRDELGNVSEVSKVVINRIDKTAPTFTTSGNQSEWVNTDVIISVAASDSDSGLHSQAYSFDGGVTWQTTSSKAFASNQTVKVKVRDAVGNIAGEQTIVINKIDKDAPTVTISGNPTEWTPNDVTLSITATDTSCGLHSTPYSFDDGKTWVSASSKVYSSNQTVKIKVKDSLGNVTATKEVVISKIDKTPPTISGVSMPEGESSTYKEVTVTAADTQSGLAEQAYSLNQSVWQSSNKFSLNNGKYTVYVRDAVGNTSSKEFSVSGVDDAPPEFSVLGNPTEWVNTDVTLTIQAIDAGSGLHDTPYSFDNGATWVSSNTKVYTGNTSVSIKARDKLNNVSDTLVVVINRIDKEVPTFSINGNPTEWVSGDVTLTVTASDAGSGLHEKAYSFDDGETWQTAASKVFKQNQTVKIRVRDALSNTSEAQVIVIDRIDKEPPTFTVSGNPADWTTEDVTLVVTAADVSVGLHEQTYSFDDGKTWQAESSKVFMSNQIVKIKVRDALGNVSAAQTVLIDKIDRVPPTFTVSGNPDNWVGTDVTLTVAALDAGCGLHSEAYSFDDGKTWQAEVAKVFDKNQTVTIRVRDSLGNISEEKVIEITKVDKTPPMVRASANLVDWTNTDVSVTVTTNDSASGLHSEAYSFDGGETWQSSNVKVFGSNQVVKVIVRDAVGNKSITVTLTIGNIDKVKPTIDKIEIPDGIVAEDKKITIVASDDLSGLADAAYSLDGEQWKVEPEFVLYNGEYTVYVRDKAGNITSSKFNVDGVDKTPPVAEVSGNPEEWTNGNAILEIDAEDFGVGLHAAAYSFDGGRTWQATNKMVFYSNRTVEVVVRDVFGNEVSKTIVIDKIDKTPPSLRIGGNPTDWTKDNVNITLIASDEDSGLGEAAYSFDGGRTWRSGNTKVMTDNQVLRVKVRDRLGNESPTEMVKISRVDKLAPSVTVEGVPDRYTSGSVTVSVKAVDSGIGLHNEPYSFDGGKTWSSNKNMVLSSNQTLSIRVRDKLGNISIAKTMKVDRIDKDLISGTVIDKNGKSVSGITVVARDIAGNQIGQVKVFNNGDFDLPGIPAGEFTLQVLSRNGTILIDNRYSASTRRTGLRLIVDITAGDNGNNGDDGSNTPSTDVSGSVTDKNGDPLPDITIDIVDKNGDTIGSGESNGNGNFVIPDIPDGSYDIIVKDENGNEIGSGSLDVSDGSASGSASGDDVIVEIGNGSGSDSGDDSNNSGDGTNGSNTVNGSVTDDSDSRVPLPGTDIEIVDKDGNIAGSGTVDKDGNFVIPDVPNGSYDVIVRDESGKVIGGGSIDVTDDGVSGSVTGDGIIVTIGDGDKSDGGNDSDSDDLWGRVTDGETSSSTPIPDVIIEIQDEFGKIIWSGVSGEDGKFIIGNVPNGDYTIIVKDKDGNLLATGNLEVTDSGADGKAKGDGVYVVIGGPDAFISGDGDNNSDKGSHNGSGGSSGSGGGKGSNSNTNLADNSNDNRNNSGKGNGNGNGNGGKGDGTDADDSQGIKVEYPGTGDTVKPNATDAIKNSSGGTNNVSSDIDPSSNVKMIDIDIPLNMNLAVNDDNEIKFSGTPKIISYSDIPLNVTAKGVEASSEVPLSIAAQLSRNLELRLNGLNISVGNQKLGKLNPASDQEGNAELELVPSGYGIGNIEKTDSWLKFKLVLEFEPAA